MRLFALRQRIALAICPELRQAQEVAPGISLETYLRGGPLLQALMQTQPQRSGNRHKSAAADSSLVDEGFIDVGVASSAVRSRAEAQRLIWEMFGLDLTADPSPEQIPPDPFLDREAIRASRRPPRASAFHWREVSRICLPGWFISRPFSGTARLLCLVGPAIYLRLEQLDERLSDKPCLARHEALLQAIARWLMIEPNTEQQAIPEQTQDEACALPMPGLSQGSAQGSSQSGERAQ